MRKVLVSDSQWPDCLPLSSAVYSVWIRIENRLSNSSQQYGVYLFSTCSSVRVPSRVNMECKRNKNRITGPIRIKDWYIEWLSFKGLGKISSLSYKICTTLWYTRHDRMTNPSPYHIMSIGNGFSFSSSSSSSQQYHFPPFLTLLQSNYDTNAFTSNAMRCRGWGVCFLVICTRCMQ